MSTRVWMGANLARQGYCLTEAQQRELRVALRFSTGVCLALVVTALALQSPAMAFALSAVGLVAGFSPRHPFDLVWNHAVRHVSDGPPLPANPTRRRHGFKVAGVWLALVGVLFAAGASTAALVVGGMLVVGCSAVTATNLCIPSEALAWWERHSRGKDVALITSPVLSVGRGRRRSRKRKARDSQAPRKWGRQAPRDSATRRSQ